MTRRDAMAALGVLGDALERAADGLPASST
jgi:hypothetical protein